MPVLFPALSAVQNDNERYNIIISKSFKLLSLITFFVVGVLFVISKDIIVLLFGIKWMPSVLYFKILLLSGFVYPLSALLVNILTSKGNSKAFLHLTLVKEIMIIINLVIGFYFGLIEYLYGLTIVYYLALILNIQFAKKEINIKANIFYKILFKYLLLTLIIILLINFLSLNQYQSHIVSILINTFVFTVIYFVVLRILKDETLEVIIKEIFFPIIYKIKNYAKRNNSE
jgi:O-antigen/teichoic acid export membrane protein